MEFKVLKPKPVLNFVLNIFLMRNFLSLKSDKSEVKDDEIFADMPEGVVVDVLRKY
jgi:hypothetical protein